MGAGPWTSLAFVLCASGAAAYPAPPPLKAKSVLVMEERSGKVLYEKGADTVRFPASTTKMMTALLLVEKCRMEELITAPKEVEEIQPSSIHLKASEQVSAKNLLFALMIRSANDAAYAVACHIGGSQAGFAKLMNERAKALGCDKTNFVNPHGLHDPKHVSTARDLAVIAREAMKNPDFRAAANMRKTVITRSINQEDLWLVTKNKVLKHDPSADGIKTGYTIPAGYCYVGSATRNGYRLITVMLGNDRNWKDDQSALMNWAFKSFERVQLAAPGAVVGQLSLNGGPEPKVPVTVSEPVYYAKDKAAKIVTQVSFQSEDISFPVRKGDKVGKAVFTDSKGWRLEAPVLAAEDVSGSTLVGMPRSTPSGLFTALAVGILGGGAWWMRRRARALF